MWIEIVAFFLALSLLFYCLFAGADFGGGILEISLPERFKKERDLIGHAMGPVWEANHIWLVLAVVILFNGFPHAYTELSVRFHIPLVLFLIGIILRGCAFTFRNYDAVNDHTHFYYSFIFQISSVLTPLMLGVIAGAAFLGKDSSAQSFAHAHVFSWFDLFPLSVGFFTCSLFAFLAAVYLLGESNDSGVREVFVKRAKIFNGVSVIAGVLVFISAQIDGLSLAGKFAHDPMSMSCMVSATILLLPIWRGIQRGQNQIARVLAASQVALVVLGWFKLHFPLIIASNDPAHQWTIYSAAAVDGVLKLLTYALVVGSVLIFPALFYLLKIFKAPQTGKSGLPF